MQRLSSSLLVPGLFSLALVVRLPTLGLPLEGASAVLASVADQISRGQGWDFAGQAPLLPLLTTILLGLGLPATLALRWTDALLAAALAPLLAVLLGRLGVSFKARTGAALLLAVHPLALLGAGGMQPGSGSAAGALLLLTLICLLSDRAWVRRLGAGLTLLLCAADPGALVFVPALLWTFARAESDLRFQTGLVLLGCLLVLLSPLLWLDLTAGPRASLGRAVLWLLMAGLLVLLPAVPRGLAALWSCGQLARPWLIGAGACLLVAVLGGPVFSLGLLPLLVTAGVLGAPLLYGRLGPRVSIRAIAGTSLATAVLLSLWVAYGDFRWDRSAGGGRARLLRKALDSAADTAGPGGWIVLAVAEDHPAEQASLADLAPNQWTWTRRAAAVADNAGGLRQLLVFPAGNFEAGGSFAVVAEAGEAGSIETFGGVGIYEQELVVQIGPYVVLRATRP